VIAGLTVDPQAAFPGDTLTLTATGVGDTDGVVARVDFYRDNGDGLLNPASDVLLGSDTDGTDGWSASASTGGLAPGSYLYFARAQDDDSATTAVSASHVLQDPGSATGLTAYRESGGLVTLEAEINDGITARNGEAWEPVLSSSYAGGQALQPPDQGRFFGTDAPSQSPQVDYNIDFSSAGTYYLWVRGVGPLITADSLHAGLDGLLQSGSDDIGSLTSSLGWLQKTMDGPVATLSVATPGIHTLNLWVREDGVIIDRLLLTTDPSYRPSGIGPTTSPRVAGESLTAAVVVEPLRVPNNFWAALAAFQARKHITAWWD
jgi:hypothetical protein